MLREVHVVPDLPLPSILRGWYAGAAAMVAGAPCRTETAQPDKTVTKGTGIACIEIDRLSSRRGRVRQWRRP